MNYLITNVKINFFSCKTSRKLLIHKRKSVGLQSFALTVKYIITYFTNNNPFHSIVAIVKETVILDFIQVIVVIVVKLGID